MNKKAFNTKMMGNALLAVVIVFAIIILYSAFIPEAESIGNAFNSTGETVMSSLFVPNGTAYVIIASAIVLMIIFVLLKVITGK